MNNYVLGKKWPIDNNTPEITRGPMRNEAYEVLMRFEDESRLVLDLAENKRVSKVMADLK